MPIQLTFLGDINVGNTCPIVDPRILEICRTSDVVVANVEGPVVDGIKVTKTPTLGVGNSAHVLALLRALRVSAVGLANNHILDFPGLLGDTKERLRRIGIGSFGAGETLAAAAVPWKSELTGGFVTVYGFGWKGIGCVPATASTPGVNPYSPVRMLRIAAEFRRHDAHSLLVYFLHWNYELERWPLPSERQLARDLVNAGVDAVIGMHSHVAQGSEIVAGRPIVYGLGNFYFPPRSIGRFRLEFPAVSDRGLMVQTTFEGRQLRRVAYRWLKYDRRTDRIALDFTEDAEGLLVRELTPFRGLTDTDYARWFARNRACRRGLPIFKDYRHRRRNALKERWVSLRQWAIVALVRVGIKRRLSRADDPETPAGCSSLSN